MSRNRSISLRIHLGRHEAHYALMYRMDDGHTHWDRRLSAGALALPASEDQPHDVLDLVRRALHALERAHGAQDPAKRSGAPGGGGGRTIAPPVVTVPLALVSDDGRTIDWLLPNE